MKRVLPCLLPLLLVACSCNDARRKIVKSLPPETTAPSAADAPGASAAAKADPAAALPRLRIDGVAKGFQQITDLQFLPGEDARLVVLQKEGLAYELTLFEEDGAWREKSREKLIEVNVKTESEMGLLGWAFHPKFVEQVKASGAGRVFVNYNPGGGERLFTRIEEWAYAPSSEGKKPTVKAGKVLLEVDQPFQNHDAGQLAFGPDGYLYIGLGDGGWRADPEGNGQDKSTLLGSMLRVDVDEVPEGEAYGIPADNPFVAEAGARPEIWAWGIRNPWRFSFLPDGTMVLADVGQDKWEEVNLVEKGDNLGWKIREAKHCFEPAKGCQTEGLVDPVFEYGREKGQSITGGYVYEGARVPGLKGRYIVGDFVTGRVWALTLKGKGNDADAVELGAWPALISTFGRSGSGEIFLADFAQGVIYQLLPE